MRMIASLLRKIGPIVVVWMAALSAYADQTDPIEMPKSDDPVLAMMDSLDVLNYFKNYRKVNEGSSQRNLQFAPDSVPEFSDKVYRERLKKLDQASPFKLDYNPYVKGYLELYANRRRGTVSRMLGLASTYFPMFEEKLAKNNMPLELKYLAIVESALNPSAKSRAGAMGLWQFMYGTGKLMGLEINSYVDERCDPDKATDAAIAYLKYLYKYFGNDWHLALAGYNAGPGNVNKAIRRSGGKRDYWELRPYLPKETNGYVPAFIAVNYIMNHHRDHNIKPIQAKYHRYEIDSIYVRQEMTFKQISEVLGIEIAELEVLNPMYITGFIPAKWKPLPVYLPKSYIGDFIVNEPLLYRYVTGGWAEPPIDSNKVQQGYFAQYHKVGRTESLEFLSLKYKVEVDTLVAWNQLGEKNRLFLGQNLVIYTKDAALVEPKPKPEPKIETPTQAPAQYHTVRSGETLWAVARKYNTTPEAIKAKNGLKSDGLQVGQRLKIK